jgi:Zn-dependent membrane protease YugP
LLIARATGAAIQEAYMNLGLRSLLLLAAIVLFVLAAIGTSLGDIALIPLGLALFAGAFLFGDRGFSLRG